MPLAAPAAASALPLLSSAALAAAGVPVANLQISTDAPAHYHPGRSAGLRLGKKVLAWFGELHPGVLRRLDVRGPMVGFEVFLDRVPVRKDRSTARAPLHLSPFQAVHRDFAFVVDDSVEASEVLRAARAVDRNLITDAQLFDIYTGTGVDDGKKSFAVEVTLQPVEATLTDEEINQVAQRIVAAVEKHTGGVLRG